LDFFFRKLDFHRSEVGPEVGSRRFGSNIDLTTGFVSNQAREIRA
jgi:hypothetical protein